jgi:hypothetical protein
VKMLAIEWISSLKLRSLKDSKCFRTSLTSRVKRLGRKYMKGGKL